MALNAFKAVSLLAVNHQRRLPSQESTYTLVKFSHHSKPHPVIFGNVVRLSRYSHHRLVGDLSIFYRYFHGPCSQEIEDIIPVPLWRVRTTRSSTHSHPFQVSLPNPRTLSQNRHSSQEHATYGTSCSSCFPESYNLQSFKSKIN